MASRVRAGLTMVDCSDAAELESTAIEIRMAKGPSTGPARAKKTLPWISGLPRPNWPVPTPAKLIEAVAASR